MTTYSDAANKYAEALHGDLVGGEWYHASDNVRAFVRAAFDAGAAHAAAWLEWHVRPESPALPVLTTAAELRALPGRAVVVDQSGMAWQRNAEGEDDWYLGLRTKGETSEEIARYGPLTRLIPATHMCLPEPERLTDATDPRIRSGAVVSVCWPDRKGPESVTYVYLLADDGVLVRTPAWIAGSIGLSAVVRLIAEAPEPEPIPVVLGRAIAEWRDSGDGFLSAPGRAESLIDIARAAGLDIVRVQP